MMKTETCVQFRKTISLYLLGLTLTLAFNQPCAQAQVYSILNSAFGNGGGRINGGGYIINGTVGQPLIGVVSNDSYEIMSGVGHDTCGILATDVLEDFEQTSTLPSTYRQEQNYPNPFNPTTTIRFALAKRSDVSLKLYNVLGQTVATLVDEQLPAGEYEVTLNADHLSSGVYFYRIVAGDFAQGRKLVLLK